MQRPRQSPQFAVGSGSIQIVSPVFTSTYGIDIFLGMPAALFRE
jgi:hypothetical protein